MKVSYTTDYIKIYFWKGISIFLNLVALFIVVPKLSSMPVVYGIYMVCISTIIFLSYADIGFVKAAFKYASEYIAQNKLKEEIKLLGFANFILFLFVSIFAIFFFIASFFPEVLIKDLSNQDEINIASKLLLIIAVFSYNNVIERFNQTVFGIRVENYVYQKIVIIVSIIKILSVFYFFNNKYDIVGYFLFSQIMSFIGSFIGCIIIKYRYNYDYRLLINCFRYSNDVFIKVKKLALSSFYVSLIWVIYYHFDKIAIAKLLGAEMVAYFSIGFALITYLKITATAVFEPFSARFNHYVGQNNYKGLKDLFRHVIIITLPFILFPTISILLLLKPFIFSWVGSEYILSVNIAFFLLLGSLTTFIAIPSSIIVIALEKIKIFIIINSIMAGVFWLGVIITIKYWNVESFAIFKFVSQTIVSGFYLIITVNVLEISFKHFFSKILFPVLIPIVFLIISLTYISQYMPYEKSTSNLFIVVSVWGISSLMAIILYYFQARDFRIYFNKLYKNYIIKWVRNKKVTVNI